MPNVSLTQERAMNLLRRPADFGRRLGFTLLRDDLHGVWMNEFIKGKTDSTTQAHRGSYKTSSIEVALPIIMMTQREKNIIFLRKTDADVAEVMAAVRNVLLNPLTQAICQVLTGKPLELYKATSKVITTSLYARTGGAPQLLGIGIGGSLTGKHADLIVTDDIVNRLDRKSRAERERTKAIYQELQNLRNPEGRIVNFGTPWHKEDAFTLMPEPKRYDCYSTGILTEEKIQGLRNSMSPSLFAANYELKHIASEEALFRNFPGYAEGTEEDMDRFLRDGIAHIDAAYGGGDYTALTLARKIGDTIYIYGRLWHRDVNTIINSALAIAKQHRCGPVYCESNGDKGYLAREIRAHDYDAYSYSEDQNKYIKISTFLKKWWNNIRFVRGTDPEYISQILDYSDTAEHDDAPDSAACVCRLLDRR